MGRGHSQAVNFAICDAQIAQIPFFGLSIVTCSWNIRFVLGTEEGLHVTDFVGFQPHTDSKKDDTSLWI